MLITLLLLSGVTTIVLGQQTCSACLGPNPNNVCGASQCFWCPVVSFPGQSRCSSFLSSCAVTPISSAANCPPPPTCPTCLGPNASDQCGSSQCWWCQGQGQSLCIPQFSSCPSTLFTSVASCPPTPSPVTAASSSALLSQSAALGGLGFVASIILALFIYSPMEKLSSKPHAAPIVSPWALHALFCASSLLWFSLGLFLATPDVPWVFVPSGGPPGQPVTNAFVLTMFHFFFCASALDSFARPLACQSVPLTQAQTLFGGGSAQLPNIPGLTNSINSAGSIAASVYTCSFIFLLPAAIVLSVCTYHLKNYLRHSTPTPTEGCARGGFALGVALGLLSAITTLGTMAGAFNLAGPQVTELSSNILGPNAAQAGSSPTIVGVPGPILGALALVCSLVAALLLVTIPFCFPGLTSLPGFGTVFKVSCSESPPPPERPIVVCVYFYFC
jgi:hypothetical protein